MAEIIRDVVLRVRTEIETESLLGLRDLAKDAQADWEAVTQESESLNESLEQTSEIANKVNYQFAIFAQTGLRAFATQRLNRMVRFFQFMWRAIRRNTEEIRTWSDLFSDIGRTIGRTGDLIGALGGAARVVNTGIKAIAAGALTLATSLWSAVKAAIAFTATPLGAALATLAGIAAVMVSIVSLGNAQLENLRKQNRDRERAITLLAEQQAGESALARRIAMARASASQELGLSGTDLGRRIDQEAAVELAKELEELRRNELRHLGMGKAIRVEMLETERALVELARKRHTEEIRAAITRKEAAERDVERAQQELIAANERVRQAENRRREAEQDLRTAREEARAELNRQFGEIGGEDFARLKAALTRQRAGEELNVEDIRRLQQAGLMSREEANKQLEETRGRAIREKLGIRPEDLEPGIRDRTRGAEGRLDKAIDAESQARTNAENVIQALHNAQQAHAKVSKEVEKVVRDGVQLDQILAEKLVRLEHEIQIVRQKMQATREVTAAQ